MVLVSLTRDEHVPPDKGFSVDNINEQLKDRSHGYFYRYMTVDAMRKLYQVGEVTFDGKAAFDEATHSPKYNPKHIPDSNILGYYFAEVVKDYVARDGTGDLRHIAEIDEDLVAEELQTYEDYLSVTNPDFKGLRAAFEIAIEAKDTSAIMDYLKRLGGDALMVALERSGWDVAPHGAFSDLIPVSVGAPLFLSGGENVVVGEFAFDREELVIPKDDYLNEHEVLVRRISVNNLTWLYASDSRDVKTPIF